MNQKVRVYFQGNAIDPCQRGNKIANLVDYETQQGESDPRIDYGDGFFIHVSTALSKGWAVHDADTGEQLH